MIRGSNPSNVLDTPGYVQTISEMLGGSLSNDVIAAVLRHHPNRNVYAIANDLLSGADPQVYVQIDKRIAQENAPATCAICLDEYPRRNFVKVECPEKHEFCSKCLTDHVRVAMEENRVPKCPQCPDKVAYELSLNEVGVFAPSFKEPYDRLLLKRALQQPGFVKCPRCPKVLATNYIGQSELCDCPRCSYSFCTLCLEDFHYGLSCQQLAQKRHIWFAWVQRGRVEFERDIQRQESEFDRKKREHAEQIKRHQEDREIALKNFEILKVDEERKAQQCKRCPKCTRVVERLAGCASMICGQNYHGGDIQNGCGHSFNWDAAPAYVPEIPNVPKIQDFLDDAPKKAAQTIHPVRCDGCSSATITGIRFKCLNCPRYNLCAGCEKRGTGHASNHVFDILTQN